ncbi:phosphoglucomutase/phosphomannomutase family protein [Clostridium sp. C105KSO13]|uniref:phosphoglucomutase/phosphomannomutase family protein n=1 Tax=Clostridium sp. C105KSO13 TaxID=1776045 RepID=UPI000740878E|nr:phosphoglucomutase/phosphomannomutase family protein [Clostridium sp. C105KSO13]CUX26654.1 Phosphoglucomutase [Clostridium sp. C105KSO13]
MIKFGTGGWRAVIGDEFTKENIQILSRAIADKMKEEGIKSEGVVLGYDRRFLSKEAMQWAGQVFAAQGIKASLINQSVPTPLVMFYVMKHQLHYGMMITASHNPAIYNGMKVFTYGGRDADERQTMEIEMYIEDVTDIPVEEMEYSQAREAGLIEEIYPLNDYLDNIITAVNMDAIRRRHLRIALDPMYGVSETSLKTILLTARCDVFTINGRHDTLFGGKLPAPNADTMRSLQLYVMEQHCDIGLATDGDADRIGVIDDEGRFLHPNDIMVLLYYYLVRYKGWKGPVVRNICTTHILDREAEAFGEICYEVPVGFKHISAKMQAANAVIGGESSGGLTVRGHIRGKDGIYAAILLVEMISVTGKKLSELYREVQKEFGKVYMEERSYKFTDEKKKFIYKILLEEKELPKLPCEIDRVSYLDGCKVYFKNSGWISARFSGTEPLLRIFCEMELQADAANICNIFEKYLGIFTTA